MLYVWRECNKYIDLPTPPEDYIYVLKDHGDDYCVDVVRSDEPGCKTWRIKK